MIMVVVREHCNGLSKVAEAIVLNPIRFMDIYQWFFFWLVLCYNGRALSTRQFSSRESYHMFKRFALSSQWTHEYSVNEVYLKSTGRYNASFP
jgi:hypothetical protein